ncbi:hypothetical protein DOD24_0563 [Staphylococcus arlettae]|nr:hypothetical protein DOD23_1283 [Staphylococcus arlettae]RBA03138.1 hypothetical protein DOD22_1795 [Staphylococcus arlettae]RBA07915.1 hypothetical protein DOD24_0563 [Staphylococcus arlettae]
MTIILVMLFIGAFGGFISGLVGMGGAIIIILFCYLFHHY